MGKVVNGHYAQYSYLLKGKPKDSEKEAALQNSLRDLDSLLGDKGQRFLVGRELSLADVSILVGLSVTEVRVTLSHILVRVSPVWPKAKS